MDPVLQVEVALHGPQAWNRYAYAAGNLVANTPGSVWDRNIEEVLRIRRLLKGAMITSPKQSPSPR